MKMESFETNLKKLEDIVKKLEGGDVKLSDSIKFFEEGVKLTASLSKALEEAESKITVLTEGKND